jgi:hypothetical protein
MKFFTDLLKIILAINNSEEAGNFMKVYFRRERRRKYFELIA